MFADLADGDVVCAVSDKQALGNRIRVAKNFLRRAKGLLGTRSLESGSGLLIVPCDSVHMMGMVYRLDVLFLDRTGKVTKVVESLPPFGVSFGGRDAYATLELPAGTLSERAIKAGQQVSLETVSGTPEPNSQGEGL